MQRAVQYIGLCIVLGLILGGLTVAGSAMAQAPVTPWPGPVVTWQEPTGGVDAAVVTDYASEVVELINEERVGAGCEPLAVDPILAQVAYAHSKDMADNDYFSHVNLSGQYPWDRISEAGYAWRAVAENIAGGQRTPSQAVSSWMNSSGHRNNILNCNYCETGVGYIYDRGSAYGHYWTQVFTRPNGRACHTPAEPTDPTPSPTATPRPQPTLAPTVTPWPTPTNLDELQNRAYLPLTMKSH